MKWRPLFIVIVVLSIMSIFVYSYINTYDTDNVTRPTYQGILQINGTEYPMARGGFKWKIRRGLSLGVVQTDHASPNQIAEQMEPIHANPNETVHIQIEEKPKIKIYLWGDKGRETEIEHHDNQINLPSSKGKYIYKTVAEWSKGTISYTFVVEVI